MSDVSYRHAQRASTLHAMLAVSAFIASSITVAMASRTPPVDVIGALIAVVLIVGLLAAVAWWFCGMTVEVGAGELSWRVGRGRPWRIPLAEVVGAVPARHPLWQGYGIRWIGPNRWTYIVSGRDTVEVRLKDGGWRRLGTDDTAGLIAALAAAKAEAGRKAR